MIRTVFAFLLVIVFKTEAQTSVLNIADSLYSNGNYTKAIELYKQHKNQQEVFKNIAKAYMAIGNNGKALKNYEAYLSANQNDALTKYEYAKLLSRTKKYNQARMVYNELLTVDDKNSNYHYEMGYVLEQQNDTTANQKYYKAFQLDSTHQNAIFRLARYNLVKGKHNLVDYYIDIGLKSYEANTDLISLRAQNYYWKQDYKNAVVWFEKLLGFGESSEFIYEKLSLSYFELYDYEKAIENRLLALNFNPNDATTIYVIGTYYENIRDYENAELYISKALKLLDKPLDDEYSNLARILNHQKKYKESIEAIKKAIRENPENEFSNLMLALTLETYYADFDSRIKAFEDFKKKFSESKFHEFVDDRISKLKKEKFIKEGSKDD